MTHPLTGVVAANLGKVVEVLTPDGQACLCELSTELALSPVAGDHVEFTRQGDEFYLTGLNPRAHVIRRAGKRPGEERVLAAHIDAALVISAVKPPLREGLIDRYLVALHHEQIEPVLVLNKADLDHGEHWERLSTYRRLGYDTFRTSALEQTGVEELRHRVRGRTSVLVGHSGVGKSTLLMALLPDVTIDTADVSAYSGKGVHTTTTARLYTGADGIRVIDSPGIRAFGLSGIEKREVRDHFREFQDVQPRCRFRDCLHLHDQGCAVRAALERGDIEKPRYESYVRIVESL